MRADAHSCLRPGWQPSLKSSSTRTAESPRRSLASICDTASNACRSGSPLWSQCGPVCVQCPIYGASAEMKWGGSFWAGVFAFPLVQINVGALAHSRIGHYDFFFDGGCIHPLTKTGVSGSNILQKGVRYTAFGLHFGRGGGGSLTATAVSLQLHYPKR